VDPPPNSLIAALSSQGFKRARLSGTRLGPYEVERELARGAMGVVLRARDVRDQRPAALKLLLRGRDASQTQQRRFARECELIRQLQHPGLIRLLDHGQERGLDWLALELVEGGTLEDLLERDPPAVLPALVQVGEALAVAHQRAIVHRDLKPANVLLRADGSPVVTDFGLARDTELRSSLTSEGQILGTPSYMAPEQFSGEPASPATDVYALGVMAYEALAGRPPFEGDSLVALLHSVSREPPPPLPRSAPAPLAALVLRALSKDPSQRPPDGAAWAQELRQALTASAELRPARVPLLLCGVAALTLLGGLALWRQPSAVADATPAPSTPTATPARPAPTPTSEGRLEEAPRVRELLLQPGPLVGVDTYVRNDGLYWNDNFGSEGHAIVGDRVRGGGDFRFLLRFDLSELPPDAEIESATLELRLLATGKLLKPVDLQLRPLREDARGLFVEGANGVDEWLDGVCWHGDLKARGARYPEATSRRPELTQPEAGEPLPQLNRVAPDGQPRWLRWPLTDLVRRWRRRPSSNAGVRVQHLREGPPFDQGRCALATSDYRDPTLRPRLRIRYRGLPPRQRDLAALRAEAHAAAEQLLAQGEVHAAVLRAPFWGEGLLARARFFLSQRKVSQALKFAELAGSCEEPAPERPRRYMLALLRLPAGQAHLAAPHVEWLLAGQRDVDALYLAAFHAHQRKDPQRARELLGEALRLAPKDARLLELAKALE